MQSTVKKEFQLSGNPVTSDTWITIAETQNIETLRFLLHNGHKVDPEIYDIIVKNNVVEMLDVIHSHGIKIPTIVKDLAEEYESKVVLKWYREHC